MFSRIHFCEWCKADRECSYLEEESSYLWFCTECGHAVFPDDPEAPRPRRRKEKPPSEAIRAMQAVIDGERQRTQTQLLAVEFPDNPDFPRILHEQAEGLLIGYRLLVHHMTSDAVTKEERAYWEKYWRSEHQSQRASGPRPSKRSKMLVREVKKLCKGFRKEGVEEHLLAEKIRKRIEKDGDAPGAGLQKWRRGPKGKYITAKTVREIMRDEGLKKMNR
jgi:hypothetical protein